MLRVAARDRMIFQLAEIAREGDVIGAADVLVAEEQHLVPQEQGADLGDHAGVARGLSEVDVHDLGADRARERLDPDRGEPCRARDAGGGARLLRGFNHCGHSLVPPLGPVRSGCLSQPPSAGSWGKR